MLAKFSVKRPYTVFVGIATAILLGVMAFINMTTDLLPKMDLPYVVVYTTYVGASPEEIENTVSKPMEAEFSTVSGLANISSSSSENLSLIIMEYESETNMDSVMLDLNAKIDALKSSFPEAVGIPVMMKINPEMLPIMIAAVDLKDADIKQLSAFTKDSLVPALEGVEGVGSVTASGLIEEDITVTLREEMVDDLNSKILREIDSELADVEQQLNDAEKELDDAEKQLNSKSKKGMKQIKDGLSQLEQAREAIPGMIAACEEQLASLRQQKREAEAGLEQINSALAQTPESMPPEAAGALSAMRRQLASLRQQLSAKQAELEALEGAQATNPPATNPPATNPPQATDAPTTTQPPQPTDTPATTQPPQATNPPAASQPPQATDAPATTQSPQATDAPGIAPYDADGESEQETPAPTEQPQSTDAPAATQQPQATEAPAATQLPQATQPPEDPPHGAGSPDGSGEQGMFSPLSAFASLFSARAESDAEKIAALRAEIAQLQAQISAIENSPEYRQLAALEGAVAQRPALVEQKAQLENAIPQLDGGIAKLEGMIEKLNNGIIPAGLIDGIDKDTDIEDAQKQLLSARSSARSAIDSAEGKIEDGREQLRQARKEFEEKRDEAFKKADLNGVITLEMLAKLLAAQNFEMPAGYVYDENDTQYLVRVGKKYEELEAMRNMLLFEMELDTVPEVRLGDVATVEITDNADSTYARIDDNAGVLLTIEKRSTASTSEVSDAIGAKFNSLMEKYPGLRLTPLFDQGIYIDLVVDSVFENLIYGGILAILVLLMFLWDFRPTFIVGISIPLSLVVAFVAMYFSNMTLNVMSLAGLALGVGMLVDNSIVIIENIYRLRSEGMPLFKACVVGAKQMSGAIFSSTLTTVCVFLPIVFVKGLARDLFTDMGLAITYSLLASLVVALTTVPALSSFMLRRTKEQKGRFFGAFQAGYVKLLDFTLRRKWVSILLSLGLLIWSALQIPGMGTSFLPEVDSNQMSVSMTLPATTTFNEMTSAADTALSRMLEIEEVDTIGVFTGGTMLASLSSATSGGKTVSFYLTLKEGKARRNAQIAEDIKERIQDLSVDLAFQTSSMDVTMLTGSGFSVAARGNDIDALRKTAKDVAALMQQVEGFEDISDGQEDVTPQITLIIDKEEAVKKKLTVAQIYMTVAASIADGTEISTMTVSGSSYPVIAVDSKSEKITPEELLNIKLEWENDDGDKEKFPLSDVATAEYSDSLDTIRRENQLRAVTASAEYRNGYNSGLVAREMQALLDTYTPPEGVTIVVSGENKMVNDVMQDLLLMIVIGIALIYFIMVAQFQSLLLPFIVLFTIPLAFTGGLVGLIWGGMDISVVSLIGFLVLAGVIVNNGIVFVDSVNQLRLEGKGKREALLETGRTRLRPILMTALTTILGMATMAMAQGMGAEMMQPMAVVVIGGLTYATFMTLFIVPALYDFFTGNRALRGAKSAESA